VKIKNNIKNKIGTYLLKQEKHRTRKNKQTINIKEAKIIGILYKIIDEETHNCVSEFIKSLQDKQIHVHAIGFTDYKEIPHYCYPKITYSFLTPKNINWHFKPTGKEVNDFLNKEFDIVIDLTLEKYLPIQYLLSQVKAKFIVGKYDDNYTHYYDMMLKVDKPTKIADFIKIIVDYLNIIKTQKECTPLISQPELL